MERKFYFYTDQMTVGYGGRPLIKNIRMEVEKGEILTLIGPNEHHQTAGNPWRKCLGRWPGDGADVRERTGKKTGGGSDRADGD